MNFVSIPNNKQLELNKKERRIVTSQYLGSRAMFIIIPTIIAK